MGLLLSWVNFDVEFTSFWRKRISHEKMYRTVEGDSNPGSSDKEEKALPTELGQSYFSVVRSG